MTNDSLTLDHRNNIPPEYEGILFKGISDYAFHEKGLQLALPIQIIQSPSNVGV